MPNPYLDILRAVGAMHSDQGQTYSASDRDMNSEDTAPDPSDDQRVQKPMPRPAMHLSGGQIPAWVANTPYPAGAWPKGLGTPPPNPTFKDYHDRMAQAVAQVPPAAPPTKAKPAAKGPKWMLGHEGDPRWTYQGEVADVPDTTDFNTALNLMLPHEGGYTSGKHDKGGATNWGISTRAWQDEGNTTPVSSITRSQMEDFYRTKYWDLVHPDHYDPMLAQVMLDSGVNCGTGTANKWLQQAQTELPNADPGTRSGAQQLSRRVLQLRQAKYNRLVATGDPDYVQAKNGWNDRMDYMRKFVEQLPGKK